MPGYDGTGPRGQGPMTGGVRGYCATGWGGAARRELGLCRRLRGSGWGAGWRRDDVPPAGGEVTDGLMEEIRVLSERVEALTARLDAAEGRER
jgi:hypothetical protein